MTTDPATDPTPPTPPRRRKRRTGRRRLWNYRTAQEVAEAAVVWPEFDTDPARDGRSYLTSFQSLLIQLVDAATCDSVWTVDEARARIAANLKVTGAAPGTVPAMVPPIDARRRFLFDQQNRPKSSQSQAVGIELQVRRGLLMMLRDVVGHLYERGAVEVLAHGMEGRSSALAFRPLNTAEAALVTENRTTAEAAARTRREAVTQKRLARKEARKAKKDEKQRLAAHAAARAADPVLHVAEQISSLVAGLGSGDRGRLFEFLNSRPGSPAGAGPGLVAKGPDGVHPPA